jgi:hypothetical protein
MNVHHFDPRGMLHSRSLGLRVSTALFGLFAIAHLGRLLFQPEIRIAGHTMPLWPSVIALLAGAALAVWFGTLAFRKKDRPPEPPTAVSER